MTDTTRFGHDQLGHILADHLLEVPRFQRSYSWDAENVGEFLADLAEARRKSVDYFVGTVVFASPGADSLRRHIVDGQQRLATTALLLVAVRDTLRDLGRNRQAEEIEKRFLRGWVIAADSDMERLLLSPNDHGSYQSLLDGNLANVSNAAIRTSYEACLAHTRGLLTEDDPAGNALIALSQQLEHRVQVLVAEASDLPEAYVIFETLNDRGADLTTADLLKNYLFSASKDYFRIVESSWTQLESAFDRAEDLVKFIRFDHASRHGQTSGRKLYRAIQAQINGNPRAAQQYVEDLTQAQVIYAAIKDPEDQFWSTVKTDTRDALYAYRRFGFEASMPVLLAAFATWDHDKAARLLVKVANWSIRGQFAGRLGGGVADETFNETAKSISAGAAKNQIEVRALMHRIIPSDAEFREAFSSYGDVSPTRAKYLLAMLEKADDQRNSRAEKSIEWHRPTTTVEHIMSRSSVQGPAAIGAFNTIGNLALLERRLNKDAASRPFLEKREYYRDSAFELTKRLVSKRTWSTRSVKRRTSELAELACLAWPES